MFINQTSSADGNADHHDDNRDGNNSYAIPESEVELDVRWKRKFFFSNFFFLKNLTEFNTAHNRRIAQIVQITDLPNAPTVKRKRRNVTFNEEDDVINPGEFFKRKNKRKNFETFSSFQRTSIRMLVDFEISFKRRSSSLKSIEKKKQRKNVFICRFFDRLETKTRPTGRQSSRSRSDSKTNTSVSLFSTLRFDSSAS